jgi:hypothetical protein
MFSKGVEAAIRDAMERGEFDHLRGAGRRVDLSAYFETPEELRLVHSMLKNAGVVPEGAELLQLISALEEQSRLAANEDERLAAVRGLRDTQLKFSLLMDSMKRKRHAK